MFKTNAPRHIKSCLYPAQCEKCGIEIPAGSSIYYFKNGNLKALSWHEACYSTAHTSGSAAHASNTSAEGGEPGASPDPRVASAMAQMGQAANQALDKQVAQALNGEPDGASGEPDGASSEPDSGSEGEGSEGTSEGEDGSEGASGAQEEGEDPMKMRDYINSGLLFDHKGLARHFHKTDLVEIVRKGFIRSNIKGYSVSQAPKDMICQWIEDGARNRCDAADKAVEAGRADDPRTTQHGQMILRADRVVGKILQERRDSSGADAKAAMAQAQRMAQEASEMAQHAHKTVQAAKEEVKKARAEKESAENLMEEASERVHKLELTTPEGKTTRIEGFHQRWPALLQIVSANVPVLMVGPAGGGKTEGARQVAEALDLPFTPLSLGPQSTQASVFGYQNATGDYVSTPFREAYENGGLILLDELDRCNERVSVTLNAAIANGRCSFPDGTVNRHENCYIIAAANTTGYGADRQYVSARQQDAALLDRFAVLQWDYDRVFERKLAEQIHEELAADWISTVWGVREAAESLGLRYVVSPRATLQGVTLLASGAERKLVVDTVLFRGWSAEDRSKVEQEVSV